MHVYDLDVNCLPHFLCQHYCVERKCHQLGTSVVRYRYVRTVPHSILISEPYPVTRLQVGFSVGVPACGLCIIRRLYFIATTTTVTNTRADVSCRIRFGVAKYYSKIKTTLTETSGDDRRLWDHTRTSPARDASS